jgi:hypothetical protein
MPDFASQEYWDQRFTKDPKPFDWLLPAKILHDVAKEVIDKTDLQSPQILHIGCGTSDAHILRRLVTDPKHVLNVDYSEAAVQAGSKRERELLASEHIDRLLEPGKHDSVQDMAMDPPPPMRWSCRDLLSLPDTLAFLHSQQDDRGRLFDLVLDKSTSDSIACGAPRHVSLPYPLSIDGWTRRVRASGTHELKDVHPLHVLAVHLAALTTPRTGRWILVSYSEDRLPFVPPFPATASAGLLADDVIQAGFPHPYQLWQLEAKERIDLDDQDETLAARKKRLSEGYVHRPKVAHWLYILRRTEVVVTD